MKTMKPGERSICTIRDQEFREREDESTINTYLSSFESKEDSNEDWFVEIEIKTMFKIDDIYGDGVLTKKTVKKGNTTAKADKVIKYSNSRSLKCNLIYGYIRLQILLKLSSLLKINQSINLVIAYPLGLKLIKKSRKKRLN